MAKIQPEDKERRIHEPTDYNRPQASKRDRVIVADFLEYEKYPLGTQLERKLNLLVAEYFNFGWDSALEKVRKENGYEAGYKKALEDVARAMAKLPVPDPNFQSKY